MKRIRIRRRRPREARWYNPPPLDLRDPDIVRAKQLMYVRRSHHQGANRA
jgi:hypothetical protein